MALLRVFWGIFPPPHAFQPRWTNQILTFHFHSVHTTNWQSAESDLATTRELVQQELDKGWIYEYPGSIKQAQQEFGSNLAVGRLGLALSDHRPARLVVDSSICGVNSRVIIPERTTLPSALDVQRTFPLRAINEPMAGFPWTSSPPTS